MPWTIESYVGVNKVKFGMKPNQVASFLGLPSDAVQSESLSVREFRGLEDPVVVYSQDAAVEFNFSRETLDLDFRGLRVFQEKNEKVLEQLLLWDPGLVKSKGGNVVSRVLGVSLSGFQDEDDSNKSFGAFSHGLWNSLLVGARPVKL